MQRKELPDGQPLNLEALDPVFHQDDIEIQQQPNRLPAQFKLRKELRTMNLSNLLNRFQLNYHQIVHQQIQPVSDIEGNAVINNRKHLLRLNLQPALHQLMSQTSLREAIS